MNIDFNIQNIEKEFDNKFNKYNLCSDFYGKSGKEHYRLLSYFSTLHNNVEIFDIGHSLHNSMALSFNENNIIQVFNNNFDNLLDTDCKLCSSAFK